MPLERQEQLWGPGKLVPWFGSNFGVNNITGGHYDRGNFPCSVCPAMLSFLLCNHVLQLTGALYAVGEGDGGRYPAGHDYCLLYHNVSIKVHHGSILSDAAGDHFHAVSQGILYKNSIRVLLNFYQHAPPPAVMSQKGMQGVGVFLLTIAQLCLILERGCSRCIPPTPSCVIPPKST